MSYYHRYKAWARANSSSIAAVEGALSSLTWLLPDRFSESELVLEGFHSLLGSVSLFHDRILQSPGNKSAVPWPFWLASLQQVEVLVEMGSNSLERKGHLNKYTPLALLESIRALLRILILKQSGARMLTEGGLTVQANGSSSSDARVIAICNALLRFYRQHCSKAQSGKGMEKMTIVSLPEVGKLPGGSGTSPGQAADREEIISEELWWERSSPGQSLEEQRGEEQAVQERVLEENATWQGPPGQSLLRTAEYLYILRSLIYVLALRRWGRRSWRPWIISLAIEAASAQVSVAAAASGSGTCKDPIDSLSILQGLQTIRWSTAEHQELTRRRLLFAYYLLKSPFFDQFTGKGINLGQRLMRPLPILGSLTDKAAEIIFGIQQYYTYTNGS